MFQCGRKGGVRQSRRRLGGTDTFLSCNQDGSLEPSDRYGDRSCQWRLELVDTDGSIAYETDAFWIVSVEHGRVLRHGTAEASADTIELGKHAVRRLSMLLEPCSGFSNSCRLIADGGSFFLGGRLFFLQGGWDPEDPKAPHVPGPAKPGACGLLLAAAATPAKVHSMLTPSSTPPLR